MAMPCPFAEPRLPLVDAFWHEFVQDEGEYQAFCVKQAGVVIDHVEMETDVSMLGWVDHYEAEYGPLDEIWFSDASGELDQEAYQDYLDRRSPVRASWNCTPGIKNSWDCGPGVKNSWNCTPLTRPPRSNANLL
ncbi:MAG: hypothetical protein HYV60_03650 [Planctomycetia bacterium]|nr:hypothetical protein [Planctomycetia bacterium]